MAASHISCVEVAAAHGIGPLPWQPDVDVLAEDPCLLHGLIAIVHTEARAPRVCAHEDVFGAARLAALVLTQRRLAALRGPGAAVKLVGGREVLGQPAALGCDLRVHRLEAGARPAHRSQLHPGALRTLLDLLDAEQRRQLIVVSVWVEQQATNAAVAGRCRGHALPQAVVEEEHAPPLPRQHRVLQQKRQQTEFELAPSVPVRKPSGHCGRSGRQRRGCIGVQQ
eukprot:scaffold103135_cov69-Phaeocystis_antarctica.AAC.5